MMYSANASGNSQPDGEFESLVMDYDDWAVYYDTCSPSIYTGLSQISCGASGGGEEVREGGGNFARALAPGA
jgi:hypothetical protein